MCFNSTMRRLLLLSIALTAGCVSRGQPFGDDCAGPGDCASGICVESARGRFCTRECVDDCDCTDTGRGSLFRCETSLGVCVLGEANTCTDVGGSCEGRDGVLGCSEGFDEPQLIVCERRERVMEACSTACQGIATNTVLGCRAGECDCADFEEPCTELGRALCVVAGDTLDGVLTCERLTAGPFWRFRSCEQLCGERGLISAGCEGSTCDCR